MRKAWSNHVNETYRKTKKKNKDITRREAMKLASETWPKEKAKLERKRKREEKKVNKAKQDCNAAKTTKRKKPDS